MARDYAGAAPANGLKHPLSRQCVIGTVFGVDDQPVVSEFGEDLGRLRRRQADESTDECVASRQTIFEIRQHGSTLQQFLQLFSFA
jgi:hypothetical protein